MKENKETSCNGSKWGGEGVRGRDDEADVTNAHCKSNWNGHYDSHPSYNKYILVKTYFQKDPIAINKSGRDNFWAF
jgi:hypothetical protein